MMDVISKIIEASPYLGFVILYILLDARREERRTTGATALENRREAGAAALESQRESHEKTMQDRQIKHSDDVLQLYASFNQQLINEIKLSHNAIMNKLAEHEQESEDRYERMGITKDLLRAATERKR